MASMNKLMVCPRSRTGAIDCNNVLAEALLAVIVTPATTNSAGNPQGQWFSAASHELMGRRSRAGPTASKPTTPQQPAHAKGAHRQAEMLDAALKYLLHQHRAKGDQRGAQHAGGKYRQQRTTQGRFPHAVSDANPDPMTGEFLAVLRRLRARQYLQGNQDEWHIRRSVERKRRSRPDADD